MDNMYLKPLAAGKFELIDGSLLPIYGGSAEGLVLLTAAQYADYATRDNGLTLWQDGAFVFQAASISPAEALAAAKAAKQADINRAAQAFVDAAAGLADVPDFEVKTWAQQAAEAEAWAADPAAATPLLAQIADARQIPLDALRRGALKKARTYSALAAAVAGQRQAYTDRLEAAADLAAVAAIEPQYQCAGVKA